MITSLDHVHPALVQLYRQMLDSGESVIVMESIRSMERQIHLYAQGRTGFDKPAHKKVWLKSGLPEPDWRTGSKVTWTLTSRHITGRALDIAIVAGGSVIWKVSCYQDLVARYRDSAEQLGIRNLGKAVGDWMHWEIAG